MIRGLPIALLLAAAVTAQQGADTGLGFLPAQSRIAASLGVPHDGLLGLAVDAQGNYYVSARRATSLDPHRVFEFDPQGNYVAAYAAPSATAASSFGLRDGAYDPVSDRIYWGCDRAGSAAQNIYAFDVPTRAFVSQHDIDAQIAGGIARGLAVDPQGRFWSCDFASPISSFDAAGVQQAAVSSPTDGAYGLGWHPARGTLWISSQTGSHSGITQGGASAIGVHLIEFDPVLGAETGHVFRADGLLPPGSQGVAGGCELHRVGAATAVAVLVQGLPEDGIVELWTDASIGAGCGGVTIDYLGGNAFGGNSGFGLMVDGLESTAACAILLGSDGFLTPVPGVTGCPVMRYPLIAITTPPPVNGATFLPLPIPVGVGGGELSFQAVEVGAALPFDVSSMLYLWLLP